MNQIRIFMLLMAVVLSINVSRGQRRIIEIEDPKLTVYLPEESNGKSVVILPGGGYGMLAVDHEGKDWAPFFNELGFTTAVLEYRLPHGNREIPMEDVRKAYKVMNDSASRWQLDPEQIGIMGSSAGGHLASTIATHPTPGCSPAFQILFYPVIALDKATTHEGTRRNFLGADATEEMETQWSSDMNVSSDTPKAFIVLSSDDKVVPPANSIRYYSALIDNNVPVEMIIYPTGGHGYGFNHKLERREELNAELTAWLKSL